MSQAVAQLCGSTCITSLYFLSKLHRENMMKFKLTFAALLPTASPVGAFALGCRDSNHSEQRTAMSCSDSMFFDPDKNACVADVTS
jgi:hypothetical protein